jgi:hypothetical protein
MMELQYGSSNKKKITKTKPKTDISSIKECTHDAQYMTKTSI